MWHTKKIRIFIRAGDGPRGVDRRSGWVELGGGVEVWRRGAGGGSAWKDTDE